MQVILHPDFKNQKNSILQLVATFFNEGDLIVKGARNTIKSNDLDGKRVNIKYFAKPNLFKSIIYSFFRSTKAKRSFDYANYLLVHNIATPAPIAYVENRNRLGFLSESYYVCDQIKYDFTIREFIHNPLFPDRNNVLEQFTEFTFRMHEASINFLDHSPGNTLIVKKSEGKYDFYLVDLNRMKFENLSIEARMDNFKKMWLSKTMVKIVASTYSKLSQQPEAVLHKMLLKTTTSFKRKITKKKYLKRKIGK